MPGARPFHGTVPASPRVGRFAGGARPSRVDLPLCCSCSIRAGRFLGRCPPVLGLVALRGVPARLEWTAHSAAPAASVPAVSWGRCPPVIGLVALRGVPRPSHVDVPLCCPCSIRAQGTAVSWDGARQSSGWSPVSCRPATLLPLQSPCPVHGRFLGPCPPVLGLVVRGGRGGRGGVPARLEWTCHSAAP